MRHVRQAFSHDEHGHVVSFKGAMGHCVSQLAMGSTFDRDTPSCCDRDVLGLDATAAQTLGSLWGSLRGADVELLLTGVRRASMLRLLRVSRQACTNTTSGAAAYAA